MPEGYQEAPNKTIASKSGKENQSTNKTQKKKALPPLKDDK